MPRTLTLIIAFLALLLTGTGIFGRPQEADALDHPEGIAFDSGNNLYIADTGNHRILVFSPDLKLLRAFGEEGAEKGRFRRPVDVAVDAGRRIIVADADNHRIQVFDRGGKFLLAFGSKGGKDGQFHRPSNVTVDERGNIIVTDRFNNRLQTFNRNGKHLFTLANRTGEKSTRRIEIEKKWTIERDPARNQQDSEINPQWQKTDPGQLNEPGGTWYDRKARELWVANGWNCRYERFHYDSRTGRIRRKKNEAIDGIVWGPWITRNCTGTPDGNFIGLQTAWGGLQFFTNRAGLTARSKLDKEIKGGAYGAMKKIHDIEVNREGDVAVADTSNSRIVIFRGDFSMPTNPAVPWLTQDGGKITWRTLTPCSTRLMLRKGGLPERTPGREQPWTDGGDRIKMVRTGRRPVLAHEAVLTGLQPGTRYFYKVCIPGMKTIPGAGWSREYALTTHAAEGKVEFLRVTLKILVLPNVVNVETVRPGTPLPEPMTDADIKRYYQAQFEQVRLFYWVNSRMKYWIDFDFYTDETMFRADDIKKGRFKDDRHKAQYEALPRQNHDKSFKKAVAAAGNEEKVYFGRLICECKRRWNKGKQKWEYQGSGGGTYGIKWPTPGRTHFLGGSDVAWLMCHEYKHQVESNFNASGLDKPEDRMWFCHFSPTYPGWPKVSAADHGEHWDGIAWQLRHHKRDAYLRAMYGFVETALDADGDGIPDNDPRLPLDEKRLGSSPKSQDTDGDGLHDLEELLASTWVRALNTEVRRRIEVDTIRPDLNNPDSDGDGIQDGRDKYPLYPYSTEIRKGVATVDGNLDEWTEKPQITFTAQGVTIEVWSRWNNTDRKPHEKPNETDALFYAVRMTGGWTDLCFVLDLDADGFYCGNDNLYINIAPDNSAPDNSAPDRKNGPRLTNARMHMCNLGRWPGFDGRHLYLKPEEVRFASSVTEGHQVFELAVPKRDILGLHLKCEEEIGLMLYIGLPGRGPIAVFEPWDIFDSTLVE